eukprot:3738588-Pleurochrysis_carterae.AAC.1
MRRRGQTAMGAMVVNAVVVARNGTKMTTRTASNTFTTPPSPFLVPPLVSTLPPFSLRNSPPLLSLAFTLTYPPTSSPQTAFRPTQAPDARRAAADGGERLLRPP